MTNMKTRSLALFLCLIILALSLASCDTKKAEIASVEDLKDKVIGVIEGSKSEQLVESYTENGCEIKPYSSRVEIVAAFESDEIDCAILDEYHAEAFVRDYGTYELLEDRLGEGDTFSFTTLASKKVYTIMLNKALSALRENGKLDSIVNGYLSDPEYKYEFAEELDNSNGTFTVSLDSSLYPYTYPADETHTDPRGIALAIIDAVCEHLGCDYVLLPTTTASLSSTLVLGVADFSIGSYFFPEIQGMEIVETEPILTYKHAIVIKK